MHSITTTTKTVDKYVQYKYDIHFLSLSLLQSCSQARIKSLVHLVAHIRRSA